MKWPALFAAAAVMLAGCGQPEPADQAPAAAGAPKPAPAGVVNVYSARHYDSDKDMYKAFEADTGIKVRFRESGAPELLETMRAEGEASPADLIISSDAGTLYRFETAGLMQPFQSDTLDAVVPEHFRDPEGYWYGLAKRVRVIAYDPERLSPDQVDEYADLASPALKGEICMRSSTNIYNLSLMGDLIDRLGAEAAEKWAGDVVANFARPPQGGDVSQIESIAAGECSASLVNHYYYVRLATGSSVQRKLTDTVKLSFPEQDGAGVHVNVTGAGLAAHAPNRDNAIKLLEWLATPKGQAMLTTQTKEFPLVADAELPEGLEALPGFTESDLPLSVLGENQSAAQEIYDRVGWN